MRPIARASRPKSLLSALALVLVIALVALASVGLAHADPIGLDRKVVESLGPVPNLGSLIRVVNTSFPRPGAGRGPIDPNWQTRPGRKVEPLDPAAPPADCRIVRENFERAGKLFERIQRKAQQLLDEADQLDQEGVRKRYEELRALKEELFATYPDSYDVPDRRVTVSWATGLPALSKIWNNFLFNLKVTLPEARVTIGDRSYPWNPATFPPDFGRLEFVGEPLRIAYVREVSPIEDCLNARSVEITAKLHVQASTLVKGTFPVEPPKFPDGSLKPQPFLITRSESYPLSLIEPDREF